jgi:hypothetical protein
MKDTTMTRKGRILKTRRSEPTVLPELESMLTVAASGQVKESSAGDGSLGRALRARPSRIVALGLACLAFGGTAMAASGVWNPIVGSNSDPATFSDTPVPTELTAALGVLRRDQTAQDRSAEVEATLDGAEVPNGVRLDSVRYLAPAANGEATILLSGVDTAPYETEDEPICVARPFAGDPRAASVCFDLPMLMSDHARATYHDVASNSATAIGVVPDGVVSITAEFGSAPDRTVPVTNNYWELDLSGAELGNANGESGVQQTVWQDADGNVVPQQPGDGHP